MAQSLLRSSKTRSALRCVEIPSEILVDELVDTHTHLRALEGSGDGRMEMNIRYVVSYLAIIVSIDNNPGGAIDQAGADRHIADARSCLAANDNIDIYAAPLMTDETTPDMMWETRMKMPRTVAFWKIFLHGVSNDGGKSVTSVANIHDTLRASYENPERARKMPVHIHAERKYNRRGRRIATRNREWYAVNHDVREILEAHPHIVLVIKHVSDWRTLRFIREYWAKGYQIYGEICAHYLYLCHEDLYEGSGGVGTVFNANKLCWPIYKSLKSMLHLRLAAVSGEPCFFYGSDWACHVDDPTQSSGVKITNDGLVCGGVAIIPAVGISLVIDLFVKFGKLGNLNWFVSGCARKVHGWPPATRKTRFVREDWTVEEALPGKGPRGPIQVLPFMRGEQCHWKLAA